MADTGVYFNKNNTDHVEYDRQWHTINSYIVNIGHLANMPIIQLHINTTAWKLCYYFLCSNNTNHREHRDV